MSFFMWLIVLDTGNPSYTEIFIALLMMLTQTPSMNFLLLEM